MSNPPLISIITPVLNAGEFLKDCARSVFEQEYYHFEWLVIDNGSTDGCLDFLRSIEDERFTLLEESDKGVSNARNAGLRNAKGDWICFLDADDILPRKSLSCRIEFLKSNPEADCIDGRVEIFRTDPSLLEPHFTPQWRGKPIGSLLALDGKCFFGPSWLVKAKNIKHHFDPELSHAEDLLFYIQNYGQANYDWVSEPVLHYRVGNSSAMSNLAGLERGYALVSEKLALVDSADRSDIVSFRRKARSIMIKSYLKQGKYVSGLRLLLSPLRK